MNTLLIVVLCVLPVVGAIVAWLGDVIGYRLGKSRRSLFGLRPRTTARLVGMLVGALLPLIGLGVAAVASQQVRFALLHLQQLRAEAERLSVANQKLVASSAELRRQVARMRSKVADAARRAEQARREADKAEGRLRAAKARLSALQRKLADAQRKLVAVLNQRDQLVQDVAALREAQDKLAADLKRARLRAAEVDKKRREAEEALAATQRLLADARTRAKQTSAQAERLRKERDALQAELADLARQRSDLTREVDDLRRKLDATREHLAEQQRKLERAQQLVQDWQDYLQRLRLEFARRLEQQRFIEDSPVIFEPGEEVVRAVVSARQRRDQIEAALNEVLVMANNVARRKGVIPDALGRAVVLVRPLPPTAAPGEKLSEEEIISAVAERIAERQADQYIVVVRALERHFLREPQPVRVEMWVTPDKVRFEEGEVLERLVFQPGVTRGEVLRRILAARVHLRAVARDRGLLPDPKTGEYGSLSSDEIIRAVDEVARAKRPVELRMVVARPVRTAEPLVVRMEVVSAPRSKQRK